LPNADRGRDPLLFSALGLAALRWHLSYTPEMRAYGRRVLECISPGVSGALSGIGLSRLPLRFLPFIQARPLRWWELPPFCAFTLRRGIGK
jgi:hypothetical protein